MTQSYLVGNPVTYSAGEECDIEVLKNCYLIQDIAALDAELEKNMSIFGKSYALIYSDEYSMPKSAGLSPMTVSYTHLDVYKRQR